MAHEPNAQQTTSWTLGREHGDDLRHAVDGAQRRERACEIRGA